MESNTSDLPWDDIKDDSGSFDTILVGFCDISYAGIRVISGLMNNDEASYQTGNLFFTTNGSEEEGGKVGFLQVTSPVPAFEATGLACRLVDGLTLLSPHRVIVVGAARLPEALEAGVLYATDMSGWQDEETIREFPSDVSLNDPMIGALYQYLYVSSLSSSFLIWPGYRLREHQFLDPETIQHISLAGNFLSKTVGKLNRFNAEKVLELGVNSWQATGDDTRHHENSSIGVKSGESYNEFLPTYI
mmetsp:Transcript_28649/g.37548  ORF Transcript_28649/g.37548 Transcript_28649/m.37548 type:complete len:246 (+) Transcript_28649:19-756(+)